MNNRRKVMIAPGAGVHFAPCASVAQQQGSVWRAGLLCATLSLTGCAPMLSLLGTNQTLVQVVAQVERVKLAGDGASFVSSSKTLTDHALSVAVGKDCKIFNIVTPDQVCTDQAAPEKKDKVSTGAKTVSHP